MKFTFTEPLHMWSNTEYIETLERMIVESLELFPELRPDEIKIGLTNTATARAFSFEYGKNPGVLRMAFNPAEKITYNTIGHELTHFVQGAGIGKYPLGERACDVYTLARDELFCDSKPSYLNIPHKIEKAWPEYTNIVHKRAKESLKVREYNRQYIKWFEYALVRLSFFGIGAVV